MGGLHTLADINDEDAAFIPQKVVLAEVSVDQSTLHVHALHYLQPKVGGRGEGTR